MKYMKNRKVLLITAILCTALFTGCTSKADSSATKENNTENTESSSQSDDADSQEASTELFAMDTYMSLKAYGENAQEAVDAAADEIKRLDEVLSTGDENSDVGQINANGGGSLTDDTSYLLERSMELYEKTDGLFDIAIYPIMEAWGFTTQNYRVPEDSELKELLKLTDASKIQYDEKNKKVSFNQDGMKIDFGGIAKGYTSARIMDIYKEHGVESGLANLGGNVQVLGTKTDGSRWRVAIQSPSSEEEYLGILTTQDKAVITSGGYERYFEQDGKTYHHIIDPRTGYPAENGLISVSIVSSDGTLADGLSTSLFIMGEEKAEAFWKEHSDEFDMILEAEDGTLSVSEGIADQFESEHEVNVIKK